MFISNGKSLFGNKGLLISISILIILVFFSYNKCYINSDKTENFYFNPTNSSNPTNPTNKSNRQITRNRPVIAKTYIAPKDVYLKISKSNVIINYSIDNSSTNELPKSFIIVLAQYDSKKKNTGNNKFYLSNESILNPKLNSSNTEKYTCNIVDSIPVCQYTFKNVDIYDANNNVFYYKIGISAIYSDGNSSYVTPNNLSTSGNLFTLITSLDNQNQITNQTNIAPTISANTYNSTISTADGQYELIKSQLGNYPDNFVLDSQTVKNGTLSDLVDKSMAQALINVKLSTPEPT